MKPLITLILAISALATVESKATVTLQFGQTGVARASGFANNAGVATNGMRWGIVIDSSGNGFGAGSYDVFDQGTNGFLNISATASDDYFVTTGLSTNSATATGSDSAVTAGAITQLTNILGPTFPSGVTANDAFRIIWFDGAPATGTYYGMMSDPSFVIPADGNTVSFASIFAGNSDPIKSANLQFPGAAVVPEPSRLMLLGLGVFGLFFRRRR
jgi:hypothetical protein